MNIIKTNEFNWGNAISLKNNSSNKSEELKKVEEQAREIIKNNPAVKFGGDTSAAPLKLTAINMEDTAVFDFIKDIEELALMKNGTL